MAASIMVTRTSLPRPVVSRSSRADSTPSVMHIAVVHTAELYSNIFGLPGAALANVPVRIGNRRELNPDKSASQIAMLSS